MRQLTAGLMNGVWLILIIALSGCSGFNKVERKIDTSFKQLKQADLIKLENASPYLKVHMRNGNVYLLNKWSTDKQKTNITGSGKLFNANRDVLKGGDFEIGIDSVSIFESNVISASGTMTAMSIYTGISALATVACITNPKACFGSCPTFYVEDENGKQLRAEGFSFSISPSLEATDIDALYKESAGNEEISIEMKNEALETHVVRSANVIAVPKAKNSRVFIDRKDKFWESSCQLLPVNAVAPEGDVTSLLSSFDGKERFSKTDSNYLAEKEIVELEFEKILDQPCGLILGTRQTLLSTYLLYQAFAYMGKDVGYWFSQIENRNLKKRANPIEKIIGGIEILRKDATGNWKVVDIIEEQGPLATDIHFISLENYGGGEEKIRLRMAKGNWRIDYAALATNIKQTEAITIQPHEVLKGDVVDEECKTILLDEKKSLTTLPGDNYTIKYMIPSGAPSYELFLESRGYYLEWMRKEWMQEENPVFLAEMFYNPEAALKRLAPQFKAVESQMEENFWSSKYAKP